MLKREAQPPDACKVLVADDDRELCLALHDVLEVKRHQVEMVHSGQAALKACSESSYDALLLDIGLPDLHGLDLVSQLESVQELDILIITGHTTLDNAAKAVSRSTIGYLVKPLDLDRLLAILDGVARRKRLARDREALLRQLAEKNAELERFTYTVSHDLKSPLITIKGFLGLIKQSALAGDYERLELDMGRISDAADHMNRLLDDLLGLVRIGRVATPVEEISLASLAEEAVDLVGHLSGDWTLKVRIPRQLPTVRGDRHRLLEVVQNLVENAIKFMGDEPDPRIEIGARCDPAETVCYVRDNGIGVAPRYHEKIFSLFDQLNPDIQGTGIGLTVVKRIVEVHGGRIWVESDGRRGSTFFFALPRGEGPVSQLHDGNGSS